MITPPVGLNCFIVARYAGRPVSEVFQGTFPHFIAHLSGVSRNNSLAAIEVDRALSPKAPQASRFIRRRMSGNLSNLLNFATARPRPLFPAWIAERLGAARSQQHCRMRENGIRELLVGSARQHRHLHDSHDFACGGADHRKAENAIIVLVDKDFHEACSLAGRLRPQHRIHRQCRDTDDDALALRLPFHSVQHGPAEDR